MKNVWNVSKDYIAGKIEFGIYAESYNRFGASKNKLTIDVKESDELVIDVLMPRIENRICLFKAENIDCEIDIVKGNLYLAFGEEAWKYDIEYEVGDFLLSTEFRITNKVLVWDRSKYKEEQL